MRHERGSGTGGEGSAARVEDGGGCAHICTPRNMRKLAFLATAGTASSLSR